MGKNKTNNIKAQILMRVRLVFVIFVLIGISIFGRIIYLNLFRSEELLDKSKKLSQKDITIPANRGDILSEDGKLLATSLPKYEVRMDLGVKTLTSDTFNKYIGGLAQGLANLFEDKPASKYREELSTAYKRKNRYYLLKRNISFPQLKKIEQLPILNKGKYKGGLIVTEKTRREKPFSLLASRTIGFLVENSHKKKVGYVGLEQAYEKDLKGKDGLSIVRRMSFNRVMPIEEEIESIDGANLITCINSRFQDIVENELHKSVNYHKADYGTAVLMEVKTGKIKAIANLERDKNGLYSEKYNYAVGEIIEPGSTFKLMSLIVALEDGLVKLSDSVDVEGGVKRYYDRVMKDSHEGDHYLSVQDAFEHSSNVGISKLIVKNYKNHPRRFIERLYSMHLDKQLGLKIKGEGQPFIKYPDNETWSGVSLPWMSIGYELHMTPLQILAFYNAIANNGKMVKPFFVSKINKAGKTIKAFDTEVINPSICSKATLEKAQQLLKGVIENGTARNIHNTNLAISGKTGTAQIADKKSGYKSSNITYNASFVGYFPSENPVYSCIVLINKPRVGGFYGSSVAAPVFRRIADKVYASSLNMLNTINDKNNNQADKIPFKISGEKNDIFAIVETLGTNNVNKTEKSNWITAARKGDKLNIKDRFISNNIMPDIKGLGLKDALFILENAGLQVKIYGQGKVYNQSIPKGKRFKKNARVVIALK